jgi:hypothetical protein
MESERQATNMRHGRATGWRSAIKLTGEIVRAAD